MSKSPYDAGSGGLGNLQSDVRLMLDLDQASSLDYAAARKAVTDRITALRTQLAEARADANRAEAMVADGWARTAALEKRLTAAEAAREAVAGEVREMCADICDKATLTIGCDPVGTVMGKSLAAFIRATEPLPTPSAALQRVREQAQREGAERALMEAWMNGPPITFDSRAMLGSRDRWVAACMDRLFPTPDAGGPA